MYSLNELICGGCKFLLKTKVRTNKWDERVEGAKNYRNIEIGHI